MPKVVFLDTMIYLHYRDVEEADWPLVLGTDEVRIIVPRVIQAELNKHKDSHTKSSIKNRARRIIQRLETWDQKSPAKLRPGVTIELYYDRPKFELSEYDLDSGSNDDVLLATALDFKQRNPGREVMVITHDASVRLMGRRLGLEVFELPEELLLASEVDPIEQANRDLRAQLERIQRASPKLTLGFQDTVPVNLLRVQLRRPPVSLEEYVLRGTAEEEEKHPQIGGALSYHLAKGEVERYDADRAVYFTKFDDFLREEWAYEQRGLLSFAVSFVLINDGTAVADDTDVYVKFPSHVEVMREEEFQTERLKLPKRPRPPRAPRTVAEKMSETMGARVITPMIPYIPNFADLARSINPGPPPNVSATRIGEDGLVHWKVLRTKHRQSVPLHPVIGIFSDFSSAAGFTIKYHLQAAGLPDEVRGELHVRVEPPTG